MGEIFEAVEQEEQLLEKVVTVKEFTCLGDKVSAGVGCQTAGTARTRFGWVKFRVCSK